MSEKQSSKTQKFMIGVKIFYTFVLCSALIGIVIVSFIMKGKWNIINLQFANVGAYGLIVIVFLILQQIFSVLNNNWWIPKLTSKCKRLPKANIQVVGYMEDPKLFYSCLTTLSQQTYQVGQIIAGVDGNGQADMNMINTFKQVFPTGKVFMLDKLYENMTQQQKAGLTYYTKKHKYVCIAQPHAGKRDIMYTCFHCHSDDAQLIALTDSDTMWNPDTLVNLVQVMVGHDSYRQQMNSRPQKFWRSKVKECGSVTGDVGIWNIQNYLTYLTSLRYWSAFNVERACDSLFGVVTCVSGPLGLYRRQTLQKVSHSWIQQTFMGDKCTFGDDRHLSNLILEENLSIFYTPLAKCKTDCPAELLRWIPQQTRWCKSFLRQFFYNVRSFYKQPLWMSVELVFQFVYPFFVLVTLLYYVTFSLQLLLIIFSFIVMMTIVRVLLTVIRTRKIEYFHFSMYVFLYIFFLIPSKFFAYLTVWNTQWGTSGRFARYGPVLKAIHALIWAVAYAIYLAVFAFKFIFIDKMSVSLTTGIVAGGFMAYVLIVSLHWNTWGRFILVPRITKQLEELYSTYRNGSNKPSWDSAKKILTMDTLNPQSAKYIISTDTI